MICVLCTIEVFAKLFNPKRKQLAIPKLKIILLFIMFLIFTFPLSFLLTIKNDDNRHDR